MFISPALLLVLQASLISALPHQRRDPKLADLPAEIAAALPGAVSEVLAGLGITAGGAAAAPVAVETKATSAAAEATAAPAASAAPEAAPAAGEGAAEEGAKAGETEIEGAFGVATPVSGGNQKTDILFPPGAAGKFEVEYNGTAANAIFVTPQTPSAAAPAGLRFVDASSFVVRTTTTTQPATDTVKIDYIFSESTKASGDVTQGKIGRFDPATQTFVTDGIGEFEFEAEENEWTLTVEDLNGEWATFMPLVGAENNTTGPATPAAGEGAATNGAIVVNTADPNAMESLKSSGISETALSIIQSLTGLTRRLL